MNAVDTNVFAYSLDRHDQSKRAAAKLHRTHISLIERGRRSARIETIFRLAQALRTQPAEHMPPIPTKPRQA